VRARTSWRNAQPHLNEEGEPESIDEVEKRMITTKKERDRTGRVYTRRVTVGGCALAVPTLIIDLLEIRSSEKYTG
jgi:hypothetical protein